MRLGEGSLQAVLEVAVRVVVLLLRDVTTADEGLGVQGADGALRLDEVVHERLRHRGVVALVVAASAVADEVDDDVAVELLAVRERQVGDAGHGLRVVAVHVEDRRLDRLRHVGRVHRRASGLRRRGEPDLVVDDEVHGAAGAVATQLRHLQGLDDDALARHRGVAVHEHRERAERAGGLPVLLGADDALEHAVHRLEV